LVDHTGKSCGSAGRMKSESETCVEYFVAVDMICMDVYMDVPVDSSYRGTPSGERQYDLFMTPTAPIILLLVVDLKHFAFAPAITLSGSGVIWLESISSFISCNGLLILAWRAMI